MCLSLVEEVYRSRTLVNVSSLSLILFIIEYTSLDVEMLNMNH
jgi:hypothetical protein